MRTFRPATAMVALAPVAVLVLAATPAAAQVIPDRVAPLVRADGFELLPSRQLGMGGVSIALGDTFGDPWSNPASAARITGARVFGSPIAYGVSARAGGGGALPVGVIGRSGPWFGAGAVALQTVQPGGTEPFTGPVLEEAPPLIEGGLEPARGSMYGFALLGRSWPERGLSLGASVVGARRHAVDGIGLLYADSHGLESSGVAATFRLGLLGEASDGRSFEAVAVHSRTRMVHDVTYAEWLWDPEAQMPTMTPREERNAEDADVWGLQLLHARPIAPGWRIGWLVTANLASHPAVPRYDNPRNGVTDIAAGRGETRAWNIGVGVARDDGPVSIGADLVYEPIRSLIRGEDGTGPTIENRIHYSNGIARIGAAREWRLARGLGVADARLGLAARLVDYRLAQVDHRQEAGRDEHRRWVEWSPTWGGGLRLGDVMVRYHASILYGTERPGVSTPRFHPCDECFFAEPAESAPLPGRVPGGALEPVAVTVVTQQLFVSVRVGGAR